MKHTPLGQHPTDAEWMAYLYGELGTPEYTVLTEHLNQCPTCQERTRSWKTAQTELDQWRLAKPKRLPTWSFAPWVKWGIAALLVLGIGFASGRATTPSARQIDALRRQLRAEFQTSLQSARNQLAAELLRVNQATLAKLEEAALTVANDQVKGLLTDFVHVYDRERDAQYLALVNRIRHLELDRAADRQDLEKVALTAQGEIWQTREQLGQLAAFKPSGELPPKRLRGEIP